MRLLTRLLYIFILSKQGEDLISVVTGGEIPPPPSAQLAAPTSVAMAMLSDTGRDKGQETTKELGFPNLCCFFLFFLSLTVFCTGYDASQPLYIKVAYQVTALHRITNLTQRIHLTELR